MDAILFDIDDTLYDQAQPFAHAVRSVLGSIPASDDELFDASRRHSGQVFAALSAGRLPTQGEYVRRMQQTMADFGVSVDRQTAIALQRAYSHDSGEAMSLSPTMAQVLDLCHRHASLGVVSNGRDDRQRDKLRILGVYRWVRPEDVFVSDAMGVAKPDAAIFLRACRHMGVEPSRSLYVGDAFRVDVAGAHAAGMPVVWFNHRNREMPRGEQPAEHEVRSAEQLLSLMRSLLHGQETRDA
jgi:HAD superfamily hydrolase (TIGR01549 family)